MNTNALFSSQSPEWPTPQALYHQLNREFRFDLDPCPVGGKVDGRGPLFSRWDGGRVFCNPPYGPDIANWLVRAREPILAVFLLPARTDTKWFHELVLGRADEIRFIKGRLKFGNAKNSAPFPSFLAIYRNADPGSRRQLCDELEDDEKSKHAKGGDCEAGEAADEVAVSRQACLDHVAALEAERSAADERFHELNEKMADAGYPTLDLPCDGLVHLIEERDTLKAENERLERAYKDLRAKVIYFNHAELASEDYSASLGLLAERLEDE